MFRGRHLLALDAAAGIVAFAAAFALRFDAPSPLAADYLLRYALVLPMLLLVRAAFFVGFGLYQRVWRYASAAELQSIVLAVGCSALVGYGALFALAGLYTPLQGFPRSIAVIETTILLVFVGGMRFSFHLFGVGRRGTGAIGGTRTIVVGAGAAGASVARSIIHDPRLGLLLVGFVDDAESKGHRLLGLPVLGPVAELQTLIRQHDVGTVLFALPAADGPTLRRLVRVAGREGARALTVPSMSEVLAGQVTTPLREIQVEDLLRRAPAKIDLNSVGESLAGKVVLVTGAGGSIGSELCRQIVGLGPARLILLGRGENSIYETLETLHGTPVALEPVIADVQDRIAIPRLFRHHRPDVVFHAAAHKHVSFMELFPEQAIGTNVLGTLNLLRAAEETGVETFVFVSTDKAVRPTNVMGVTKRVAELAVREAARRTGRRFVVVRFGNVLSSRGSVLPRFRRQLEQGGPLTVSHPQVRRFFMTVSEAVQLILQASALGRHGETFVLDMGEPVLIEDLARDLIEMHGLIPGRDIAIEYTGLLAGEKLDEELFLPDEEPERTEHEAIFVARDRDAHDLPAGFAAELEAVVQQGERAATLAVLQHLVPEYDPAPTASPAVSRRSEVP